MTRNPSASRYWIFLWATIGLIGVWACVLAGYWIAEAVRPTPEKLTAYATTLDLTALSQEDRRAALEKLAKLLNGLNYEDRRDIRLGRTWGRLFEQMTESEKAWFVEQTLPSGVKQMLDAFETLPEDKRRRAVDDSLGRLRESRAKLQAGQAGGAPEDPVMSEETQRQIVALGMKTFYSESSAQTKAELAPVLEEMQRLMESGRLLRERRRREL